jgi:pimeloyl-ACP methyl ester carboxylesterase
MGALAFKQTTTAIAVRHSGEERNMPEAKINVVLVHGAWAECASWSEIIPALQKEGLEVICAPLPLTTLGDDVSALDRLWARLTGDIILVGHAYAGAVIGAARHERVKSLVYVAALAPDEKETVADIFYREAPHPLAPRLAPDRDGFIWMPREGFTDAFAQNAAPDVKSMLFATQRPINVKCIQETSPRPLWREKPSWYLVAEHDRMIPAKTQYFQAKRMGATVRAHSVDHSPMLTAPNVVVDVVLEAIRSNCSGAYPPCQVEKQ